jgi:hypothetical protein
VQFQLDQAVGVLERTPKVVRSLLTGLPEAWIRGDEGPDTWSPFDVLGHLIHGERTDWIPRARIILESGTSRPFDPFDRVAMFRESRGKTLTSLFDEFAKLREANLATLASFQLTPQKLALAGTHPALGRVTLAQLLAAWVVHDLDHLAQISRVMAKQYTVEVGPWKKYMSILGDRTSR